MPTSAPELYYLIPQVINHAIDLLDHGFREYLYFDANLHRRNWASSNQITRIEDRCFTRNNLAKCPIAAAGFYTSASILDIQYAFLPSNDSVS